MISSTSPRSANGAMTTPSTPRTTFVARVWNHFARVGEARARRELISLGYGHLVEASRLAARRDR
jgi:hypothetical protein